MHRPAVVAEVANRAAIAAALEGAQKRRVLPAAGAEVEGPGGVGEVDLKALGGLVEAGDEPARQPRRARAENRFPPEASSW